MGSEMCIRDSYRGSPGEPVPAQAPMGWLTPELLRMMQIPVLHCHHEQDIEDIGVVVSHALVTQAPVAILIDFKLMGEEQ